MGTHMLSYNSPVQLSSKVSAELDAEHYQQRLAAKAPDAHMMSPKSPNVVFDSGLVFTKHEFEHPSRKRPHEYMEPDTRKRVRFSDVPLVHAVPYKRLRRGDTMSRSVDITWLPEEYDAPERTQAEGSQHEPRDSRQSIREESAESVTQQGEEDNEALHTAKIYVT